MKRKTHYKNLDPNRHDAIIAAREHSHLREFYDSNGNMILLNPYKHMLLGKPYKRDEFKRELARVVRQDSEMVNKFVEEAKQHLQTIDEPVAKEETDGVS